MFDIEKTINEATKLYQEKYEDELRYKLSCIFCQASDKGEETYCDIWNTYLNNHDAGALERNLKNHGYDIVKEEIQSSGTLTLPMIKLKLTRTVTIAEV